MGNKSSSPNSKQILEEIGLSNLPSDWEIIRVEEELQDTAGIAVGVMYPGEHDPFGIPLLKSGDLSGNRINPTPPYRITKEKHKEYRRTELSGGELLISLVGDIGRCAVVSKEMAGWNVARAVAVLRFRDPTDVQFIRHSLMSQSIQHLMHAWATTTVQATLNLKEIRQIPIPWPPKKVRDGVAEILLCLDDKIENNRRMNETLEAMARSLFKDWFVDFGPVRAKMEGREPPGLSAEVAGLFPDKFDGLGLPNGWMRELIYSISKVIYGAPFASERFNSEKRGKPLIRIRDLKDQTPTIFTDEEHPKGYLVTAGNILVGMDGEFRAYLWGGQDAWLNQRVCSFMPINGFSLAFVHNTIAPQLDKVESSETATTVIHLGKNDIDRFTSIIPDEKIKKVFSSITDPLYKKIVELKIEARTLLELRDSLLPKLLSGAIQIKDVDKLIGGVP